MDTTLTAVRDILTSYKEKKTLPNEGGQVLKVFAEWEVVESLLSGIV